MVAHKARDTGRDYVDLDTLRATQLGGHAHARVGWVGVSEVRIKEVGVG